MLHPLHRRSSADEFILGLPRLMRVCPEERHREVRFVRVDRLQILDLLVCENVRDGVDVVGQVTDLATAN